MYLILERAGTFRAINMIDTATKCGAMAMNSYNYRVKIQAKPKPLTPQGYVINNEEIQNFFDERFGEKAKPWMAFSCENMARVSCEELGALLQNRKIKIKLILVTLEGSNGALITAEWQPKFLAPLTRILKPVLRNPFAIAKWNKQDALQLYNFKNDEVQDNEGGDL